MKRAKWRSGPLSVATVEGRVLGESTTLYRGIGSLGAKKIVAAGLKKGTIITDPGFMSTSRNAAIAKDFASQSQENMVLKISAGPAAKAFDINKYSHAGFDEREVLFARNSRLKVVSWDKKSKTLSVEVIDE